MAEYDARTINIGAEYIFWKDYINAVIEFNLSLIHIFLVEQFNNQQAQLQIADDADKIAQKRYSTNVETFMVVKISTLDLNDSQSKKDEARQKHINELFYYGTIITSCAA